MTAMCKWLGLVVVCATVPFLVPLAPADDTKATVPIAAQEQAGDVELLAAAYRLGEIGDKHGSPEALVGAGSLILKVKALTKGKLGELAVKPEVQDEKGNPIADAKVESPESESLDDVAQGFFDSASNLGTKLGISNHVEALIKAAKTRKYDESTRSTKGGPKIMSHTLRPHQTQSFHITFNPNSIASVGLTARSPVRARMGSSGVAHFDQMTAVGQYTWMPRGRKGETVNITIHNPHNTNVNYRLFTN